MPKHQGKKLNRNFFARPTLEVAPEILGKYLVYNSPEGKLSARITEVEAYIGTDDPACHAFGGLTKRNLPLFGPPGYSYIYFIYGMYYCFNFVTEPEGQAAAILLRSAEPEEGIEIMKKLSPGKKNHELLNGPGKFCRSFGLNINQNNLDLTSSVLFVEDRSSPVKNVLVTGRIGISKAQERPWRFCDADSYSLSRTGLPAC